MAPLYSGSGWFLLFDRRSYCVGGLRRAWVLGAAREFSAGCGPAATLGLHDPKVAFRATWQRPLSASKANVICST